MTVILFLFPAFAPAVEMEDYCLVPPYVKKDVSPNIMILMDVSSDMNGPAYPGNYSENATKDNYDGYFNPQGCYRYTSKFEEVYKSTSPDVRYTASDACPSAAPFRGNLMNWATMSKFDILQKVIIGGNATSKQGNAHTLVSISGGTWTERVYAGCRFRMVNGTFTIQDAVLNGDCSLVLPTPAPIASLLRSHYNGTAEMMNGGVITVAAVNQGRLNAIASGLSSLAKKIVSIASTIWDNIHFVSEAEAADCAIDHTSSFSSSATVGSPYSFVMQATGGSNSVSFTWTFNPAAPCSWLPAPVRSGNRSQTATANGTPNTTAACNFTVTASRSGCTAPAAIAKTITPVCPVPVITTSSLNAATVGQAYAFNMVGSGAYVPTGHNPWSASGLPAGITINASTGAISGIPTACGTFNVVVNYTGAAPCGTPATKTFSMAVTSGLQITQPAGTRITDGQTNNPYSYQLQGSGGAGTYNWSTVANCPTANPGPYNCFPHGLTLNTATGLISGTPTFGQGLGNDFTFRVTLADQSSGCSSPFKDIVMRMNAAATPINISSPSGASGSCSLPAAIRGEAYSFNALAGGGTQPYTWTLPTKPAWLNINAATGVISGTAPNSTSTGNAISITVTGSGGTSATKNCTIDVIRNPNLNSQSFGNAVKVDLIEEVFIDQNGNDIYDPGTGETFTDSIQNGKWDGKQGVFQKYWDSFNPKARWGLTQFSNTGVDIPSSGCIPAGPASSFYTAIQNVQMRNSPLASGLYGDINYYGRGFFAEAVNGTYSGCQNSDPIDNSRCRKNFVLIISAGNDVSGSNFDNATSNSCTPLRNGNSSAPLVRNACFGAKKDLRSDKSGTQSVITYVVNTMGTQNNGVLADAAEAGNGNYYPAENASDLASKLELAFKDMLARAASGTAASVLASGEGSGANLIQAVFYPRRKIDNTEIFWTGRLTNLWYYVDPFFGNSSIRLDDGDKILNLETNETNKDYVAELYFDTSTETTRARRYSDTNGDGVKDAVLSGTDIEFEKANNLWEAGTELWKRSSARTIYTNCSIAGGSCIGSTGLMNFSDANRAALRTYLQAATDNDAEAIIRYVHGEDDSFTIGGSAYPSVGTYRQRKVKADLNLDGDFVDTVGGIAEATPRVWRLGDVLNSTPKIASWIPLNQFHMTYNDTTYGNADSSSGYISTSNYKNRGMVFTGSNDGMLHAFNLGKLELSWTDQTLTQKARLTPPASGTYGEEMWAYIPKHVLPYLTYQKENNYCHLYTVDLSPYVFDASINKPAGCTETDYWNCEKAVESWRTVLIGGMRFGGACRNTASGCTDCVKTPINDPADASKSLGYSSYFAIDITDQNAPKLLWEWDGTVDSGGTFVNRLGFSTTGPAIVKINARKIVGTVSESDKTKNGRWFAVIGSGPTGPIGTDQQFMGHSDQPARLFVIDVMNGPTTGNFWEFTSSINSGFIGSMLNANDDTDFDYQDDVVYAPFVSLNSAGTAWNDGGVLRLLTREDLAGTNLSGSSGNTALNPGNWALNTVITGAGPLTSAVARLQNPKKGQLWLFGGTGRYYYEIGPNVDDQSTPRHIFGIKDPCFSTSGFDASCTTTRTLSDVTNVTAIANVPANADAVGYNGWYISLDAEGNYTYAENGSNVTRAYRAEREITDPLSTRSGLVFFTTYKPYGDECSVGGKSFLWATRYDTGGTAGALLKGKGLVQVSTGSIEQIDLSAAFTEAGGRKSYAMEGVPPTAQGLSILGTPPPVKRVMHIRER